MKASELINLYQRGRRNFSGENLINQNFDNQHLPNINLSQADIRGARFVNTNLTGANFIYAKAGSTLIMSFIRTTCQLILASLSMYLAILYCKYLSYGDLFYGNKTGIIFWLSFIFFLYLTSGLIKKNFIIVISLYLLVVFKSASLSESHQCPYLGRMREPFEWFFISYLIGFFPYLGFVAATVQFISESCPYHGTWGATSFRGANLEGADFSKAALGNTDFRFAKLESTYFYQAKNLNHHLFEKTKLAKKYLLKKAIMIPRDTH